MVPPPLHSHPHPRVLTRLRCPATGSARIRIRLGLKPFCCSFSASSAGTPPPLHGPSLRRGRCPLDYPDPFARVFDLAALRVPAVACAPLERRLRGHLLNWPRVRNVVRLPNDQGLLSLSPPPPAEEPGGPAARATAVARREKLVRELNARGFLRFPNLARLSRSSPLARMRRERKSDRGDEEATREPDKDKAYVVEVVGEGGEDDEEWKGLVGEEGFGRNAWRIGSTRLLLLGERYAERKVDELPQPVKDVLDHDTQHDGSSAYELIRCHLTLFYNYWSTNEKTLASMASGGDRGKRQLVDPTGKGKSSEEHQNTLEDFECSGQGT